MDLPQNTDTQFGFVSVIGAPNAGKSTLMNQMVGAKISIVSPKAQTTRTRVLGIVVNEYDGHKTQIAFVDTPGIFKAQKRHMCNLKMDKRNCPKILDLSVIFLLKK